MFHGMKYVSYSEVALDWWSSEFAIVCWQFCLDLVWAIDHQIECVKTQLTTCLCSIRSTLPCSLHMDDKTRRHGFTTLTSCNRAAVEILVAFGPNMTSEAISEHLILWIFMGHMPLIHAQVFTCYSLEKLSWIKCKWLGAMERYPHNGAICCP